jgi:alpha-glucosidase
LHKERFDAIVASGTNADVWVKRANGKVYEGEVWPGWCFFPDYTQPRVRDDWWAPLYNDFMAQGITGVWNDMNEPAVFNVQSKTMPLDNVHLGDPDLIKPNGKKQGAELAKGSHLRYHNVYGLNMVKGTWKASTTPTQPSARSSSLAPSSSAGSNTPQAGRATTPPIGTTSKPPSPWSSTWACPLSPSMAPTSAASRAMATPPSSRVGSDFGTMLPFARGHTGKGNIDKEPWAFGPEVEATCREALERRYQLIPYLYTLAQEASTSGLPIARPSFFCDPTDPALRSEDDSFLLGDHLLIVAATLPDASRTPVMPKGRWGEIMKSSNKDLPRVFVKGGGIVPAGPVMQYVGEKPTDELTLFVCLDENGKASGTFYDDAGDGYGYKDGDYRLSKFEASMENGQLVVKEVLQSGKRPASWKTLKVMDVRDSK